MENQTKIETVIPVIPEQCDEFAKELAALCKRFDIAQAETKIKIDTGYKSQYEERIRNGELLVNEMTVFVSLKDGRGRPRTEVRMNSNIYVQRFVVREPDSTS